jgi:HEAT repeat protein
VKDTLLRASVLGLVLLLAHAQARADEPPAAPAVPALATDAQVEAALEAFKTAWKAPGTRGIERTAVREVAMRHLAQVQHPKVVERLAKLTRDRDEDIRTLAVMYLGEQRALPGPAGREVVKAMNANLKDPVYVMFAIEAIGDLGYRGALPELRALLDHKDEGVQKVAMLAVGDTGEMRLVADLIQRMEDLKIENGVSWEGGEVHYDSGAEGNADQEKAEQLYHEQYGSNARQGKSAARAMRDMRPVLLDAMKRLTGQEFLSAKEARAWAEKNAAEVQARQQALDALALQQSAR